MIVVVTVPIGGLADTEWYGIADPAKSTINAIDKIRFFMWPAFEEIMNISTLLSSVHYITMMICDDSHFWCRS